MSAATKSMQKTPLETLGFKTFFVVYKSFRLNPAKAGNWRISIIAAAALGDGRDLLFYRGNKNALVKINTASYKQAEKYIEKKKTSK